MATQLNDWLSIDKASGTGNAQITLTASSYKELVDRATSLKIQGISANAILNVRQNAFVPSATLDSYEITTYRAGTYTNGITSNVPWTAVVNDNWITIDKTQGESGYTPLSITLDAHTETRNGSIIFNAEGVVLTLQIYQIYDLKKAYFWVEFEEANGTISGLTNVYADIYHSFDGITWEESPSTLSMGSNRLVYLKNNKRIISGTYDPNNLHIQFNKNAKVGGDFSSMTVMDRGCCSHLFRGNEYLTDASELILPWETLDIVCYENMFYNCTNLKKAPQLPATTLAGSCYQDMFRGCTSLTTAPELPATTLAGGCYNTMFCDCTSLTTAPELPATTLADGCYEFMFQGCTSLTTAPALPATTLANECYLQMFTDCTSLTTAPALPATNLYDYCYKYMFTDCTSLTTAPVLPATTLAKECYYYMFAGCTSLTTAPELPATTLVENCYQNMFDRCTSLVNAPSILPATTLTKYCYQNMFYDCTNLTTAPELPATTLTEGCYSHMFYNCTSLVNAPSILPATTLTKYCYQFMFYGCTSLVNAPSILPATTLDDYCCKYMFGRCTSLTTAPVLPATNLRTYCYSYMFYNCTNLNYIKMLATNLSAQYSTVDWVKNVGPTGTFVKHPDAKIGTGKSGIPDGWTVETATE